MKHREEFGLPMQGWEGFRKGQNEPCKGVWAFQGSQEGDVKGSGRLKMKHGEGFGQPMRFKNGKGFGRVKLSKRTMKSCFCFSWFPRLE